MENKDILEEQRKELLEMFSHQQNKWAELNRKLIWVVLSAFASEVVIEMLSKVTDFSKTLLIILFCTALASFMIESFRFIYCSKGYLDLAEEIKQGKENNPYSIPSNTDAITKVGLRCQQYQAILFFIIMAEFLIYAISLLFVTNPNK